MKNSDKFNFFIPIQSEELEKAGKVIGKARYKNMVVEGLASDSSQDTDDEMLEPNGYDLSRFMKYGFINYDHRSKESPKYYIGEPTEAKVTNNKFFVRGKLYEKSQIARDLWDTMILLKESNSTRKVGWSIEGVAKERHPQNKKRVTKALITNIALTMSPKNSNSYANIVKGEQSEDYIDYKYEDDNVEKSIQSTNGGIVYLIDITNPKNGMRYTIDKDLNLKVEKAMDTTTAKPLIKESLEGKKKKKDAILNLANAAMVGTISKGIFDKATENYKMSVSDDNYNTIRKAFLQGKVGYDILKKAKGKNLQAKNPGSNWVTINGAKVLIGSGGNVIAGAGGKLGGGDKKEGKKETKTAKGYGGEIARAQVGDKVKVRESKGGGLTSGTDGEVYEITTNGKSFKLKDEYGNKDPKLRHITDFQSKGKKKVTITRESEDTKESGKQSGEQMLKELKSGKSITLKDMDGKEFQVKYVVGKSGIVQGLQMFRDGKKIRDVAMKENEMENYLSQFEGKATKKEPSKPKKKESGKKESYHKDDKLNEFRDIAANSKDMGEFMTKVRAVKNVPPDVSQQFSDKYNPNENLSMESSAKKMFDEVKVSGLSKKELNNNIDKLGEQYNKESRDKKGMTYKELTEKRTPYKAQLNDSFIGSNKNNIISVKKDSKGVVENIKIKIPTSLKNEDKLKYKLNSGSFHSNLTNVSDIKGEIKYIENRLATKNDAIYRAVPSLKQVHKDYLSLLKIKEANPNVDLSF